MLATPGSLRQVSLGVDDVDRAVAFYAETLDLPLIARYGDLAFFDLAGIRLLLEPGGGSSVLYLAVTDIHAERSALESKGIEFVDAPHVIFTDTEGTFGPAGEAEWMTFFTDGQGNTLALSSREPPPPV